MGWNDEIKMPTPQFRLSLVLGWGKDGNNKYDIGDISTCGAYSCVLRKAYVPIVPQCLIPNETTPKRNVGECRSLLTSRGPPESPLQVSLPEINFKSSVIFTEYIIVYV